MLESNVGPQCGGFQNQEHHFGVFTIRFTVASSGAMGMVHVALLALDYFAGLLFT